MEEEFKKIKHSGVEVVIFRCFKNPGDTPFQLRKENKSSGVYFMTRKEPLVSNLLPDIISAAHKQHLKVYGWITTRTSQWILRKHPEWRGTRYDPVAKTFSPCNQLDVFNPDVQSRIADLLLDLAATGVDGILLQDDWVSRQGDDLESDLWIKFAGHSFSVADANRLFKKTAKDHTVYRPYYYRWSYTKAAALSDILKVILEKTKKYFPSLSIAVNIYPESISTPGWGCAWLAQDLELLTDIGIDKWAIMAYQRQMKKETHSTITAVANRLKRSFSLLKSAYLIPSDRIIWKVQVMDWQTRERIAGRELAFCKPEDSGVTITAVPYRGFSSIREFLSVEK